MIKYKAIDNEGTLIKSSLTPFSFPAGEAHIKAEPQRSLEKTEIAIIYPDSTSLHDDLFKLAMWSDALTRAGMRTGNYARRVVIMPYLPGARADRGEPFGLEVYMNFFSEQLDGCEIYSYDVHSEVGINLLGKEFGPDSHMKAYELLERRFSSKDYEIVIAPDKGAVGRASEVAQTLGLPLVTAEKVRDFQTGKLKGYSISEARSVIRDYNRVLVVDDICDGGGTFALLANAIDEAGLIVALDLYVSHGIFSGNALENLSKSYRQVFTTNSYDPLRTLPANFHRLDVIRPLLERANV